MPEVVSEGVRLAVEVIGEGEPVTVVAHGLTGTRRELTVFAPFVPGTKVLFDFRGHGASERPPPGSYSMDLFAADVDNVATAFEATGVIGVSLGGGATLRLLCSQPSRFEKLVIILPARLERSSEARRKLLRQADVLERYPIEEATEIIMAEEEAEGAFDGFRSAREMRRQALLDMNGDGMPWAIRGVIDDPPLRDREPITRVTAEVLVVGQEGDPVHAAAVARDLADAIPRSELLMFPDPHALLREIPVLTQRVAAFLGT